jgi:hypothetical protein
MCRYRIRSNDIAQANYTDTEVQRVEDNLADMLNAAEELDADFLADSEDGDDGAEEEGEEEEEGEGDARADEATEVF